MSIVEYSVIRGDTVTTLIRNVGLALRDGFQPFGQLFVDPNTGMYVQAVVVYDSTTNSTSPSKAHHGSQASFTC